MQMPIPEKQSPLWEMCLRIVLVQAGHVCSLYWGTLLHYSEDWDIAYSSPLRSLHSLQVANRLESGLYCNQRENIHTLAISLVILNVSNFNQQGKLESGLYCNQKVSIHILAISLVILNVPNFNGHFQFQTIWLGKQ